LNAQNWIHFHRKSFVFNTLALVAYAKLCHSALKWDNELMKIGIAGSLA